MKKPTTRAQNSQNDEGSCAKQSERVNRENQATPLDGEWTPFNHEHPNLKPGLYWAVGMKQRDLYDSGQGITPFQIMIEVFSDVHEMKILPAATVPYSIFDNCLPHIAYVQPLIYPRNPYTQSVHQEEFA